MAVVTISREYGSAGDEVARLVCQRLGYRYFDKAMMATLCDPAKAACESLADLTEDTHKVQGLVERFFAEYPMSFEAIVERHVEPLNERTSPELQYDLVESLNRVAYEHGNVIIVGRGGQAALRGKPGVLHVRVLAPVEARTARVQAEQGLSAEEAGDKVAKRDEAAADYVQRFGHVDAADPRLYNLVINTGQLAPATAADLIVKAVESLPAQLRR